MENRENNIDGLIKKHLEAKMSDIEGPSLYQNCPSELELSDYLEGELTQEKENLLLEHIAGCRRCLSLLELARESAKEKAIDMPSLEMLKRAKGIVPEKPKKGILNYKWQILAAVSFLFSFILTRYFLQFLTLAVIFSLKWVFDTGTTRTLIMIYEAWRKKDKGTAQRIIQDLRDKIGQRR